MGPNMLRPMMKASAAVSASISLALASGCSNIQRCRLCSTPSPSGFSSDWLGPATKPSTEMAVPQVTLPMVAIMAPPPDIRSEPSVGPQRPQRAQCLDAAPLERGRLSGRLPADRPAAVGLLVAHHPVEMGVDDIVGEQGPPPAVGHRCEVQRGHSVA